MMREMSPNSVVTAEVESGIGYTVGSSSSASVTVEDNDIPPPGTPEVDHLCRVLPLLRKGRLRRLRLLYVQRS